MIEQREWGWLINGQPAPASGQMWPGDPYTWWRRGATDEHFLAVEGVSKENQQLLEVVRGLSRLGIYTNEELCLVMMQIYFGEGRWAPTVESATPMFEATPETAPPDDTGLSSDLETG